jgi:hypothetical protein
VCTSIVPIQAPLVDQFHHVHKGVYFHLPIQAPIRPLIPVS